MKSIDVYVNTEGHTFFPCPHCEDNHRISVAKYKGVKHSIIARCICNQRFEINLNFRQFYRKTVRLVGEVKRPSSSQNTWLSVTVVDLSMGGLRFKRTGNTNIEKNHRLLINFTLDDRRGATISKELRVVEIIDDLYGCEFLNLASEEKELGYYLFPG